MHAPSRTNRGADADRLADDLLGTVEALHDELARTDQLATLGMLTAAIAHELNNIFTPMLSYAQMALASPDDQELSRKAIERSERGARRASEIVASILNLARGESKSADASLLHSLDAAVDGLVRPLERDGISIERAFPSGARLRLPAVTLEQVLLNTLANARHAVGTNRGHITVSAARSTWNNASQLRSGRQRLEECGLTAAYPTVGATFQIIGDQPPRGSEPIDILAISDSGSGVPPSIATTVFEPLVTQKQAASGEVGTGLGLAICRRLVHAHGGYIWLHTASGVGTTVIIATPAVATTLSAA